MAISLFLLVPSPKVALHGNLLVFIISLSESRSSWQSPCFYYSPLRKSLFMAISLFLLFPSQKVALNKKLTLKIGNATSSRSQVQLTYFMHFPWPPLGHSTVHPNNFFLIYTCWEAFVTYSHVSYEPLIYERNHPAWSISKYNLYCLLRLTLCIFVYWIFYCFTATYSYRCIYLML
jgi:hypothetical protein